MKKLLEIFELLVMFTVLSSAAYAVEEVSVEEAQQQTGEVLEEIQLEHPKLHFTHHYREADGTKKLHISTDESDKTLAEKIQEIYETEYNDTNVINPLLAKITTVKFDEGPLDNLHVWAAVQSHGTVDMPENSDTDTTYGVGLININIDGQFKGKKEDFRIMLDPTPQHNRGFMSQLLQDAYIATNRIPHHRILVGNSRPGVGYEGAQSPYTLPFINRSQISRTFANVRKAGVRVQGNYSLVDYDFGGYSSDTYFQDLFPGLEFDGWVNLKPLGKTDGKYGKLITGGGISAGKRYTDYFVSGAYVRYEYKKFTTSFEWAHADGYNGAAGVSTKKASGFYTSVAYKITPKVQILARYDQFDPDTTIDHNNRREYTAGLNYFIKGQGMRVILNYVFCQNDNTEDSHRILLGTQFLL